MSYYAILDVIAYSVLLQHNILMRNNCKGIIMNARIYRILSIIIQNLIFVNELLLGTVSTFHAKPV